MILRASAGSLQRAWVTRGSSTWQAGAAAARSMTIHPGIHASSEAEKQVARKQMQATLRALSTDQMAVESAAIAQRVLTLQAFQRARRLAIYVHCERLREVDTTPILEDGMARPGARVYVPRVLDRDANMHFLHLDSLASLRTVPPFGIREPEPEYADGSPREDVFSLGEPVDVVVMPGLAFNRRGHRLGRGGGYYDKFIATCQRLAVGQAMPPPLLLALAFESQMVDAVPVADNDEDVDIIVTAHEVIGCTERGRRISSE